MLANFSNNLDNCNLAKRLQGPLHVLLLFVLQLTATVKFIMNSLVDGVLHSLDLLHLCESANDRPDGLCYLKDSCQFQLI